MVKSILISSLLLLSNQAILNVAAKQPLTPREGGDDDDERRHSMLNNGTMAMSSANSARDLFSLNPRQNWVCNPGYSNCPNDASRCCPTGDKCCGTGYCAGLGDVCCPIKGSCPAGWGCCGASNCYPKSGECCSDGKYCKAGRKCRIYKGMRKCCLPSGCVGENDKDDDNDDGNDDDDNIASGTTTTTRMPFPTNIPDPPKYEYYTTVVIWYFYVWFYTAAPPYTVTTVTSTRESTSTTWSVYASNSVSAMSELADRSSTYSFPTPAMATIFKPDSTTYSGPVATASGADNDSGSGNLNSPDSNEGAASSITSPSGSSFWWMTICLGALLPFFLFTIFA